MPGESVPDLHGLGTGDHDVVIPGRRASSMRGARAASTIPNSSTRAIRPRGSGSARAVPGRPRGAGAGPRGPAGVSGAIVAWTAGAVRAEDPVEPAVSPHENATEASPPRVGMGAPRVRPDSGPPRRVFRPAERVVEADDPARSPADARATRRVGARHPRWLKPAPYRGAAARSNGCCDVIPRPSVITYDRPVASAPTASRVPLGHSTTTSSACFADPSPIVTGSSDCDR